MVTVKSRVDGIDEGAVPRRPGGRRASCWRRSMRPYQVQLTRRKDSWHATAAGEREADPSAAARCSSRTQRETAGRYAGLAGAPVQGAGQDGPGPIDNARLQLTYRVSLRRSAGGIRLRWDSAMSSRQRYHRVVITQLNDRGHLPFRKIPSRRDGQAAGRRKTGGGRL
jgi:hypothetical protein